MVVRHARMEKSLLWPLLTSASPHSWSHDRSFENIILSNKELMTGMCILHCLSIDIATRVTRVGHCGGQRPDTPSNDMWCLRLSKSDQSEWA
ncbi:hypothetical protein V6N12_022518 [Hibiscus sabdariffa]|uniref:Secreted protein n=1 Tax=Hibiscus sabdariffa TaxID=183260 RepID=A0ABR2FVR7_9ROSI